MCHKYSRSQVITLINWAEINRKENNHIYYTRMLERGEYRRDTYVPKNYTTLPDRVEAEQVSEQNGEQLAAWTGGQWNEGDKTLSVPTIFGTEVISVGDWVVKNLATGRLTSMGNEAFIGRYHLQGQRLGSQEYRGMQFDSEDDLQAVHQRRGL